MRIHVIINAEINVFVYSEPLRLANDVRVIVLAVIIGHIGEQFFHFVYTVVGIVNNVL